jgi:hypothetical protein
MEPEVSLPCSQESATDPYPQSDESSPHLPTLDGGEWSASRPGCFTPRERVAGTHWLGGWMSPRAVLDTAVVKRKIPSARRESNPRTPIVQPVAQSYTDWAITALTSHTVSILILSSHLCLGLPSCLFPLGIPGKVFMHSSPQSQHVWCNKESTIHVRSSRLNVVWRK